MTDTFYIKVATIVGEHRSYDNHYLLIRDGKIASITPKASGDISCYDFGKNLLVPGFIDLHIHGREGCDVMDADLTSLDTISKSLAKHGVTGFLATTVTSSWEKTLEAFEIIGKAANTKLSGAELLGGYSEGLFFTSDHKGAHNEDFFLELTRERIDTLMKAARGQLKVLALAPEIDGACEMISYMREIGIRPMLGHTNATYDDTSNALKAGACGGVHVFNGMRGIHHREPGCTGAVLVHDTNVEVIADGVHLHPAILKLICKLKHADQITLISDCINAGGLTDGRYKLGETDISVNDGIARTDTGSLAGSTLTLEKAVQNLANLADIDLRDAIHMASLSPAKFLGIENEVGSIAVGKKANLTVLTPAGTVLATYIAGQQVFGEDAAHNVVV